MLNSTLIAFYGGTFDPIHYGHLKSVIALARIINLQQVILLPNNIPPHRVQPVASAKQRLDMLRLAIGEMTESLFTINESELKKTTPSYTVDTFKLLRKEYGPDAPLAFIVGEDSLLTLPKWHFGLEILDLCHILVCARSGFYRSMVMGDNNYWIKCRLTCNLDELNRQPAGLIYYGNTPQLAISSSYIRRCYQKGSVCDGFISFPVQRYIDVHSLYR